jgi:EAL domain-containing protein (putative c-di-GMP-specific phosphodiesterase class I)
MRLAEILQQGRAADRGYRIGGDEFAVVLTHTDTEGAAVLARRLAAAAHAAGLNTSIGISVLREGQPADVLRAEADAALYEAKRQGGSQIVYFADIREHTVVTSAEQRDAVKMLIEEGRLSTSYQPIWDLNRRMLLGFEALTRPHPDYGLSGPAEAFDVAEQTGRVHQLDVLCVTNALTIGAQLPPGALLFINLCPQTLDIDGDKNGWLLQAVADAGLSPEDIVIEVTERFGGRLASVAKCLRHLQMLGFKVALDDVGTGNSGLEILRAVRADFVKLDRSLVAAAATEPSARAMLTALATYAHQTGAYVIAEGIEDDEILDALLHLYDYYDSSPEGMIKGGQGYGLGRPSPAIDTTLPDSLRAPRSDPLVIAV